MGKHMQVQDERLQQAIRDRQAAKTAYDSRRREADELRLLRVEEMKFQDRQWQNTLAEITGSPRITPKKKTKINLTSSESLPAIWDRSLEERATAERHYWKWSQKLKYDATCAVDHKLDLPGYPKPKDESSVQ